MYYSSKINYYNLININSFLEKLSLSNSNLNYKKTKFKKFIKFNLKSLSFLNEKFLIFFMLFLFKKNSQQKILILKNFSQKRKNYKKNKPKFIKFNYIKLFKNISSYHNEKNQILYNLD